MRFPEQENGDHRDDGEDGSENSEARVGKSVNEHERILPLSQDLLKLGRLFAMLSSTHGRKGSLS